MKELTYIERAARGLGLALLTLLVLVGLGGLVGCGPRLCKVIALVPDQQGGVTVDCDGDPWGIGKVFKDLRKCGEEKQK